MSDPIPEPDVFDEDADIETDAPPATEFPGDEPPTEA